MVDFTGQITKIEIFFPEGDGTITAKVEYKSPTHPEGTFVTTSSGVADEFRTDLNIAMVDAGEAAVALL